MKTRKKSMSRISALLLALVMMLSLVPTTVFAAEDAENHAVVIAGSDFQNKSCTSTDHTPGVNAVQSIVNQIKDSGYTDVDGLIFCGDYYKSGENGTTESKNGMDALDKCITDNFGDIDTVYVQGNHDAKNAGIASTGAHDTDHYGVYVIDEDDYESYTVSHAISQKVADNLKPYLDAKIAEGYDKPIFIASHVPLHAGPRTIFNGQYGYDNTALYAKPIFDVINEAAEDLNIIFLFGHNHSCDHDSYLGGSAIYMEPGDNILIADESGTKSWEHFNSYTLNFTYMNAGYVGYYDSYSDADSALTMTSFEINGNSVIVNRYDANGLHVLKHAGDHTTYRDNGGRSLVDAFVANVSVDATTYDSPRVIGTVPVDPPVDPEPEAQTFTDPSGISVVTKSGTGLSVSEETVAESVLTDAGISKYQAYDINIEGYEQGNEVQVTMPVPEGFDANKTSVYHVNDDGTLEDMNATVEGGVANFTTNHFSVYMVAENDLDWKTIGTSVGTTPLTSLSNGQKIVIQCIRNTSYYVTNTAGTNANRLQMITDKTNSSAFWSVTRNSDGTFYLQDADGKYMTLSNGTAGMTDTATKLAITYSTYSTNRFAWEIKNNSINYYLNQYSQGSMAAGYGRGVSDEGSRWNLYEVNSVYAALGTDGTFEIPTGRYSSQSEVETFIRNNIVVYTNTKAQSTGKTETTDYTFSGSLTPNEDSTATLSVMYKNVKLGELTVKFVSKEIESITVDQAGTVYMGDKMSVDTGSRLTITYDDGSSEEKDVTLSMVEGDYNILKVGTYSGQTIRYAGHTIDDYTLNVVVNPNLDPFPKSPNEGSVTINKTATGIDFKNTGVAQVELSARGIPYQRGVDVIIMLDASSSMARTVTEVLPDGTTRQRARSQIFAESFKTLLDDLKGAKSDVTVAIADFNGFGGPSGEVYPYARDASNDVMQDGKSFPADEYGYIYTGTNANKHGTTSTLNADAFIDSNDLDVTALFNRFNTTSAKKTGTPYQSGTNYDYAFWAVYQLGAAIEAKNAAEGKDRDLAVIFMTDGAANQYNGFATDTSSTNATPQWSYWLTGTPDGKSVGAKESDFTQYVSTKSQHGYFFGGIGTYAQKNRWNEAVKGDPSRQYTVIDKTKNTAAGANQYLDSVPGLGAYVYSIGFNLEADGYLTAANAEALVKEMATSDYYIHFANSASDLNDVFASIRGDIFEAATDAYFEDQMGAEYDLRLAQFGPNDKSKTYDPTIEVVAYDVWKRSECEDDLTKVGERKSNTPTVIERITFNADGTEAYSNQIEGGTKNILNSDGVIVAKNFVYNTDKTNTKTVTFNGKQISVAPEYFHWNLGTINEREVALRYYVYLTDTMEGHRDAGSYPTNDHATLFYTNYAGAGVSQKAPVPVMAWEAAVVKYAAYLVNDEGQPVNAKGEVTGFADRIIVTNPQEGAKVLFNNQGTDVNATVLAKVLPDEYTLYDPGAKYTVVVNSGTQAGSWAITRDGAAPANPNTTYVTGFSGNDYSNDPSDNSSTHSYTATTVWFAVKYTVGAIKDVVVIDYGLPVDISVLSNDMFYDSGALDYVGGLEGVGNPKDVPVNKTARDDFAANMKTDYGTATVRGNYVRYQVDDMNMTEADTFYYAVNYAGNASTKDEDKGYYYGEVTVIPATTIYYEDSFVAFSDEWGTAGTTNTAATQDEDRPGTISLTTIDANNVYGFDSAYKECSTYSMGSARKVTVDSNTYTTNGQWPTAQFTFTGTGFDVISLTSNMSGFLKVDVYQGNTVSGTPYKSWAVDTYYGYDFQENGTNPYVKYTWVYGTDNLWHTTDKQEVTSNVPAAGEKTEVSGTPKVGDTIVSFEKNGEWVKTNSADNALYQIPVIKSEGLTYDQYTVVISAMYSKFFNHTANASYDLYLDAIRIYDPAKNDPISQAAYVLDNEAMPEYLELRNNLIDADTFAKSGANVTGAVFIDGLDINGTMADYTSYGPNNEVYLSKGQAVAFVLEKGDADVASVQLGVKALSGDAAVKISALGANNTVEAKTVVTKSATDLYYDMTNIAKFDSTGKTRVITISNSGDNLVSLTNIKITYVPQTADAASAPVRLMMSAPMAKAAADYMSTLYFTAIPEENVEEPAVNPAEKSDEETVAENNKDKGKKDKADKNTKPGKFKPSKMDVALDNDNIKVGDKTTLTVKTSTDVAAVTVNGENAVLAKTDKSMDEAVWTVTAKATEAGTMTNSVVAYDADGIASEEIISVESVKESRTFGQMIMNFIQWIINWISGWFKG